MAARRPASPRPQLRERQCRLVDDDQQIRRLDPVSGVSRSLTPPVVLGPDDASTLFDVDASGKKLAMTIYETRGDIWLIEGSPGSF